MRAATKAGLTFVGGQIGLQTDLQVELSPTEFKPRVIGPDSQAQAQREVYHKALQALALQLETLIASADPKEAEFWRQQLDRLKGT